MDWKTSHLPSRVLLMSGRSSRFHRDTADFEQAVFGKPRHFNGCAAGRVGGEKRCIDLIHLREIVHIAEIDRAGGHVSEPGSRRFEDRGNIVQRSPGLFPDTAFDKKSAGGIETALSGHEHGIAGDDRLTVGADGARR